jgi:hypothetical protein
MPHATAIRVSKSDLSKAWPATGPTEPLQPGEVLLKLDRYALTANNVTYAVFGEPFGYWRFFPAPEGEGHVPVWGFGDVVDSRAEGVGLGQRIYGYFPFASHLVVTPGKLTGHGFTDIAAHRQGLSPFYNDYHFAKPGAAAAEEGFACIFRPLFATAFLIDLFLADENSFGAKRIALSSASSKTALGLAYLLKARGGVEVVALTSQSNAGFCQATCYYDRVVSYGDYDALPNDAGLVLVDMAGDGAVRAGLAARLGDQFVYNCMVGGTHWDAPPTQAAGPAPTLFFAPDHATTRTQAWGQAGFNQRLGAAWGGFEQTTADWLKLVEFTGPDEALAAWAQVLAGKTPPNEGLIGRWS